MSLFRADLHCHTTCSDGTMSPEEIVKHAVEIGLKGLSITDHDTVDAYKTALPAAKKLGLKLGAGVEFSSMDQGGSVHILGYDVDIESQDLKAFCQRHIDRRKNRNQKIIEKLERFGLPIDSKMLQEEIAKGKPVGRPHIALAMMQKGYVRTMQEAFNRYLGDKKPCFDPGEKITTDETIHLIKKVGGKAFIAHPHFINNARLLNRLLEKPFDGIECYYSKCGPDQERKWIEIAREKNLIMSGGSDFHGEIKPAIPLGCSWVNEETFQAIFKRPLC